MPTVPSKDLIAIVISNDLRFNYKDNPLDVEYGMMVCMLILDRSEHSWNIGVIGMTYGHSIQSYTTQMGLIGDMDQRYSMNSKEHTYIQQKDKSEGKVHGELQVLKYNNRNRNRVIDHHNPLLIYCTIIKIDFTSCVFNPNHKKKK
eukprot:958870_1